MSHPALAQFVRAILNGTADIGITMLPLVSHYKNMRNDPKWREAGLAAWLIQDPDASAILAKAMEQARTKMPEKARIGLIMALGGTP